MTSVQRVPGKASNRPQASRSARSATSGNGEDHDAGLRAPPQSLEAEQSVLGGLLLDNGAWPRAAELVTEADFYVHEHRVIFGAIGTLVAATKPADVITVFEQLQSLGKADECGGLIYLNVLAQSVPSAATVPYYAGIVRDRAVLRKLVGTCDEIATSAFKSQGRTVAQIVDAASAAFDRISRRFASDRRLLLPLASLREASQALRWVVKRVIPAEALVMLFGASGTFKSFIALDLVLHVAHGLPWLGQRTQQGAVIYIAAEGGAGVWNRIDAWHRARGLDWQNAPVHVVPFAIDLGTEARRIVNAARAIGVTPALVVVDTLSQTYAGDENVASEMAAYLRELGLQFREMWRCAVLLIHHSGHSATERPRGSSAITPNVDVLMGAHRDEREMLATVSNGKMKDGECFADATFSLSVVEVGEDADGDKITSLVARHLSTADEINRAVQAEQQAGRAGRGQHLMELVQNGERERELRKAFYETLDGLDPKAKKQTYYRHRNSAVKRGLIEIAEGIVIDLRKST